jgi:hypothetical protein
MELPILCPPGFLEQGLAFLSWNVLSWNQRVRRCVHSTVLAEVCPGQRRRLHLYAEEDQRMAQLTQFPQSISAPPERSSWIASSLWCVMLLLSAAVAVYGATYFLALPDDAHFAR